MKATDFVTAEVWTPGAFINGSAHAMNRTDFRPGAYPTDFAENTEKMRKAARWIVRPANAPCDRSWPRGW